MQFTTIISSSGTSHVGLCATSSNVFPGSKITPARREISLIFCGSGERAVVSSGAMRAKLVVPAVAAACLLMPACIIDDFGAGMRYSQDFHYSYPLNANGRVTVETFNGSVEVTGWDQNTIDISGTKYGPTQQAADDLRVNIDHSPDRAEIRVPRPSERRNNQGAKLVIKVPRAAVLD